MIWKNTNKALQELANLEVTRIQQYTRYPISVTQGNLEVTINLPGYYQYIVNGRRPGKMPPKDAIATWISIKHIVPKNKTTVDQLTYLIRRKIARYGTTGKPEAMISVDQYLSMLEDAVRKDLVSLVNPGM